MSEDGWMAGSSAGVEKAGGSGIVGVYVSEVWVDASTGQWGAANRRDRVLQRRAWYEGCIYQSVMETRR